MNFMPWNRRSLVKCFLKRLFGAVTFTQWRLGLILIIVLFYSWWIKVQNEVEEWMTLFTAITASGTDDLVG